MNEEEKAEQSDRLNHSGEDEITEEDMRKFMWQIANGMVTSNISEAACNYTKPNDIISSVRNPNPPGMAIYSFYLYSTI